MARHVAAVERRLRVGRGLLKIFTEPDPTEPPGVARLVIKEQVSGRPVTAKFAYIVYGIKGLPYFRHQPGPAFSESERRNAASVRLSICHELAHLTLPQHCVSGAPGELRVPAGGFDAVADTEACVYAIHVIRMTSTYLAARPAMFSISEKELDRVVHDVWPEFWRNRRRRRRFHGYLAKQIPPWADDL